MVPPPVHRQPPSRFSPALIAAVLFVLGLGGLTYLYQLGGQRVNAELEKASAKARAELPTFVDALNHRTATQRFFVRGAFGPKAAPEILWVRSVVYDRGDFWGRLDQQPRLIRGLNQGDEVVVKPEDVRDWAIKDGEEIRGRYTEQINNG